jgi:WD40 repeat protein
MKGMAHQPLQEIPGQPSRREQIFEVSVFLLFLIIPMVFGALFFLIKPEQQAELKFFWMAISSIFELLVLVALIFFFAWRNKEPLGYFGWNFKNGWRDIGLGIVLYFPLIIGIGLLGLVIAYLWQLVFPGPFKGIPHIPQFLIPKKGETLLAFILVCVVATTEEIIFRGYLLRRFQAILGGTTAAVLLSSALFAFLHFSRGLIGVVVIFFVGIFYAVVTLRRQSLVTPIVLHFLQDFILVLIPLFGIDIGAHQQSAHILSRLHGHKWDVNCVAFSPGGKILASGSVDKTIILWDVETRQPLGAPLEGHHDSVESVAFSPEGTTLASGSRDKTIILWDVKSRRPLGAPLAGHKDWVESLAFSPDGKLLASGSLDETIILWNVETHQPQGKPMKGQQGGLHSVAFSPDGKQLASAGRNIILWDMETRHLLGTPLKGHQDEVECVAFSFDGKLLASASTNGTIILWDVATRQPVGKTIEWLVSHYYNCIFCASGEAAYLSVTTSI